MIDIHLITSPAVYDLKFKILAYFWFEFFLKGVLVNYVEKKLKIYGRNEKMVLTVIPRDKIF